MQSLIPEAAARAGDDPIFAINAEANRRRAAGEAVVNASLGALVHDDGALATMPVVFEVLRAVDLRLAATYAPIPGPAAFLAAARRDALGTGLAFEHSVAVATPGGTGALHHALVNFLEPGQAVFAPNYYWGPYETLAKHTRRNVATFPMFDAAGVFDQDAFAAGLDALVRRQGRALVFLNFPCNNPTGYSLDECEWRAVADSLARAAAHGPVIVLVDLAYASFGRGDRHQWVQALGAIHDRVTVLAAWTASKAFTQYGARVGALIAVTPDAEERARISSALAYSCRGTWSICNHLGMLAITSLLTDAALAARADSERAELVALLDSRVEIFNREARAVGLSYPRYEGGFFVSVFTPDAALTALECAREGVFVVPQDRAVRVALCSTSRADVPRLCSALARGVLAAEALAP
jgi:aromatic-amino-acid transaminase